MMFGSPSPISAGLSARPRLASGGAIIDGQTRGRDASVTDQRLPAGKGRERRRVGAQDARTEPHRQHLGNIAQGFQFFCSKTALGSDDDSNN